MTFDGVIRRFGWKACASGLAIMAGNTAVAQSTAPSQAAPEQAASTRISNQEAITPEIVVTSRRSLAGGLMKPQTAAESMSSITPAAIQEKLAVASPLQVANTLPGANFGSSDAYGLSIRNFLSVRGLDQTEIGFLVDGVPGVSIANYYPYAEAWADNENISDITLTPGNSRLQDPIINASGGELIESIRAPRDKFGGKVSASVGSYGGYRAFGDIETGYIGGTGVKAFLSYSHTSARNYVGPGRNKRDHIDFRVQKDWSDRGRSTLFVSYDHLDNARIPILNRAQAIDGIENDRLEQYAYSATYVPGVTTAYYKLNIVHTDNILVSNNNDFQLNDKISLHIVPYYKFKHTNGPGQSKLSPTSIFSGNTRVTPAYDPSYLENGSLVAAANTTYTENLLGVNSYVEAQLTPTNQLSAGYWYQHTLLNYYQFYELVDQQGNIQGLSPRTALRTTAGALITGTYDEIRTNTHQFFVGDTQSLFGGRMAVTIGFKQLLWKADVDNHVIGAPPHSSASWSRTMPRILASFKLDDRSQLYANVTTNARMPLPQATYATIYNITTGATSAVGNTGIKPEYTISSQIGYRYSGPINIDVSGFYMKLRNHQVQGTNYVNGILQTTALNVGGETIKGASLEASTRSYHGFSLYGNTQYLDATFDDNLPLRGDYLPTRGKKMVLAPTWMGTVGGRYEHGGFYASVTWKYVGEQYSSFVNDETIPSISTVDAGVGYRFHDIGMLKAPTARFTVTNIGNKPYISTLSAATPNAIATRGINGTAMPASAPTYYVGAGRAALFTLTTDF